MNILVLCTGNSARSILLESLLNGLGNGRVHAFSAGSQPAGKVHPQSISLLKAEGFDVTQLRSKSWDEFAGNTSPEMDLVITVCSSAAGETCPIWPGAPLRANWGVEDPAAAPKEQQAAAFRAAFDNLRRKAVALLALPLETINSADLKKDLERIGRLT